MKFSEIKYERIDIDKLKNDLENLKEKLLKSNTKEEQLKIYFELNDIAKEYDTNYNIMSIRNTINTFDSFYEKEREFLDENSPKISLYFDEINKIFANSKFRKELEKELGSLVFDIIDTKLKVNSEAIIEELQEENRLTTEYSKLISSAKIYFDGEEKTLSQMTPYIQNKDRNIRKEARLAVGKFFENNIEKFDNIYDGLVKVRDKIAKKLGFNNFIEVAYLRLNRLDYNHLDVENYRKQIMENIVPLYVKLGEEQAKRIKVDKLKFYDEGLKFLTGNPTPKGNREWMVEKAIKMYDELSPETSVFFREMVENELLDLDSKKGKQSGGYCTGLPTYKLPFIFANFNGTSGDVEVLTHEAGHAFQVYTTMRNEEDLNYQWPTFEAAEIHSMSMEFLTWPWMKDFFEDDIDKFKYNHLSGAINFLPYGALVDHFQHYVYENVQDSPEQRRMKWLELEKQYLPNRDYDGIEMFSKGFNWFAQGHIFEVPFYYIDYTLAQIVALQFWKLSNEDRKLAWEKYYKLCQLGGTKTFLELIKEVKLDNPFVDGTIAKILPDIKKFLEKIDKSKF